MTNLRGKRVISVNHTENFSKVKNTMWNIPNISSTDTLILMKLNTYPSNWVLAYTRLADDLGKDKTNIIKRWKKLIKSGHIIETESTYSVNYSLIEQGGEKQPEINSGEKQPLQKATNQGGEKQPDVGGEKQPTKVVKSIQIGGEKQPNEQDIKDKERESKTKEQEENQNSEVGIKTKPNLISPKEWYEKQKQVNTSIQIQVEDVEVITSTNAYNSASVDTLIKEEGITPNKKEFNQSDLNRSKIQINSLEDFFNKFNTKEVIKELLNLTFNQFIKVTDPIISDYDLQQQIYYKLQKMDTIPNKESSSINFQPTDNFEVFDFAVLDNQENTYND